jgi:hypothetical protein
MPRREQQQLPHTAGPKGPCDDALDRLVEATEAATEALADRKRAREALMDRMQETGVSRVAVTVSGKRRWLEITADPKLRSVAVSEDGEQDAGGGSARSRAKEPVADEAVPIRRAVEEQDDPFAATREALGDESPNDEDDRPASAVDLRTAGQQRRSAKRGAR